MGTLSLAGDFLGGPGTGALGGPPVQHNYKRAVCRAPPREFTVEVLSPTKFGSGYCYGMRICPTRRDTSDDNSSRSGGSHSEYEIWRRWEDCLWFQEILEEEYGLMARTKRQRLAAGKGVKKNGVYIHSDQAASFESLPPGPEVKSVAKDVHGIIPKLTKKGTLFRASQATIDQRGREFEAMMNALWSNDVPSLVAELREQRVIRDFFGWWRRDMDNERKMKSAVNGTNVRHSVASSTFSMYFSASNISLQLPQPYSDLPPSPALPTTPGSGPPSRRQSAGKTTMDRYAGSDSATSSSSLASSMRQPPTPMSAPAGMTFPVSPRDSLSLQMTPSSSRESDLDYITAPRTAPPHSKSMWLSRSLNKAVMAESGDESDEVPVMYVSEGSQWSEGSLKERSPKLQALPEDRELVPAMSNLTFTPTETIRPPIRRSRINSCPDRTHRNGLIFMSSPPDSSHSARITSSLMDRLHSDVDLLPVPDLESDAGSVCEHDPKSPITDSSRQTSVALTTFSAEPSRRSSWRTSVASEASIATALSSSYPQDSCADLESALGSPRSRSPSFYSSMTSIVEDPVSPVSPTPLRPSHMSRASISTMNSFVSDSSVDAVLPKRFSPPPSGASLRRSFSAGSRRRSASIASSMFIPSEEWYDQQEDLIDAYFYDPGMRPSSVAIDDADSMIMPEREAQPQQFNKEMCTPDRFPKPFRDRPAGQFHLPWTPRESQASLVTTASPTSSANGELITIKVTLEDSIVLLRATFTTSLVEVRARIVDKFAKQEGMHLSSAFAIGYIPPAHFAHDDQSKSLNGRSRSYSTSSLSNPQTLRHISSEDDWQTALATCSGKLAIRLFNT
ncbi:hypothetical protein CERSUDRAFT_67539 [Gelatoporia subvermispora B]|uniref:PX domain-containing protein n=1 Tax=Ceriporiopsis subvermispora (strain B) TaxID=914234 RepID=M2R4S5_CERS8|nr:hypothetical protein CERSUDRAFT_67539 [Gelatoporia subvermispora B]